jgi:hypothetical protein
MTRRNHLFASLCAYVKLESLKIKTGLNHFALKSKIYLCALQTAFAELGKLNPRSLTRNISYELKTFTCRDVKGIPDNRVISPDYRTT